MTIGLLKEPDGENRVALLPESVKALVALKVDVQVESKAGETAFASNADYEAVGASTVDRQQALAADLVVGINPPTEAETSQLKSGQVLIAVFQPLSNKPYVNALLAQQVHFL